jgi:hypothetical protein
VLTANFIHEISILVNISQPIGPIFNGQALKVKVTLTQEQAMKVKRGSRHIALLFL